MSTVDSFLGMYLEEDEALKNMFNSVPLTVSDVNNPAQKVPVYFTMAQQELRKLTYPYGIISFINDSVAHDREHRGYIQQSFVPYTDQFYEEVPPAPAEAAPKRTDAVQNVPWPNTPPSSEFPIPIDLDYQVDFYTRSNRQIRQLQAILNADTLLHPRFAYLQCSGGTNRRIDVLSKQSDANFSDQSKEKREFRLTYELRINSEIMPTAALGTRIQSIVLTLTPY